MRKITLFLMLFCAFVGTALAQVTELSQLSNDKIYAIKSGRCFLLYSEANAGKLSTSTATAITDADRVEDAINNPNQQFKIQKTGENYYLYSVGAGKYLAKDGSLSDEAVDALEIHDVRANFPNYPWKLCIGGNGLNTQIANQTATGIIINTYTTADAGNTFQIVDIEEKPLLDALNELSTLVNNAKQELSNKHKVALQTTDANAPFYLSATVRGDAPISAAIDNNPATYYGSTWGSEVGHHHYWQVDLADAANLEEFTFSYITRATLNDTPTKINVQGSDDGTTFTDIVVLTDGLPTTGGATYNSAKIVNQGYRYIRFEVPSTINNYSAPGKPEQEVTISIAEFSLSDANLNNYSVNDKNKANAISAAEAVLNADNNTLKSVQDAIVAFNEAMVSGQCTVSYSFIYKGVEKLTQEVDGYVGDEYPAFTVLPYGVSATKPAGVIDANDVVDGKVTKTIEVTDALPFVAAADYASITKWYYLKIKDASYLSYAADQEYIDLANKSAVDASNKDAYTWAFIGNPFDGFQVVNMAAGSGKILSSSTTMNGESGEGTWPIMTETPVAAGNNTYWTLTATTANIANGFFMGQKGFASNRMNNRGNKLAYWTGGADAGSTFTVEERDFSGATELQAVIDQVEAFIDAGVADATTVGYLTSESVNNVATALAAAKEAVETKIGCNEAQVALQAAVNAVETIQPEEGKFYTLLNSYTGCYMNVNNNAGLVATAAVGSGEVFQFVKENGNLYLKNVERGTYLNTALAHAYGQNSAAAIETENAKAVTISNLGKANQVSITPNGGATLHHDTNNNNVVAWNAGVDSKSAWIIAEVDINSLAHTLNVTNAEWATLVLGYNAEIPDNVTVYAVSELNENAVTLSEVKNAIPAGAAVLINAAEGTYEFNYIASADAIGTNLLKGTVFNTNIAENAHVLGMIEGEVGLYTATMNANEGAAFLNNAFKAYLPKTNNAAQTLRFNFGETTGIEGVIENTNANAVIFDLSGRRVVKMQKGIYIVNGKKVYVK